MVLDKLNPGGIFITQSGPAGILSCTEVFTAINCTLRSVFPAVVPYTQHMPVFCDVWGYNMALTDASQVGARRPAAPPHERAAPHMLSPRKSALAGVPGCGLPTSAAHCGLF